MTNAADTEAELREIVRVDAGRVDAWSRLAELAARRGDYDDAIWSLAVASRVAPHDAGILNNLAFVFLAAGRPQEAEQAALRATAIAPRHALALMHLGQARSELGRHEFAEASFRAALKEAPQLGAAHFGLAAALARLGRWSEALAAYEEAARCLPDSADPWIGRANAQLRMGLRREAVASLLEARTCDPGRAAEIESHALFAMQFGDEFGNREIGDAHRAWGERHAAATALPPAHRTRSGGKIRLGYVSPSFHGSAMAFALLPVLERHDRARFEITCYAQGAITDDFSKRIRSLAGAWRDTRPLDDAAMAQRIREDGIDVLVDLAGHTEGNRLRVFALRPAPVQVTWLDYFNTTGVAAMDALLADQWSISSPLAQAFTERVIPIGPCRYCYEPPAYAPDVVAQPARAARPVTFGSFARMQKICASTLDAWSAVLREVAQSRFVLKNDALSDPVVRGNVQAWFGSRGIDASRLDLRAASGHRQMLAEYADLDIVLDTIPYNGGITTLEALWMGRPVISLAADTLVARQGSGILHACGLQDWVARDTAQFVRIASSLAADREALAHFQATLRDAMRRSPLVDAAAFTRRLESVFANLLKERETLA